MILAKRVVKIPQKNDLINLEFVLGFEDGKLKENVTISNLENNQQLFSSMTSDNPNDMFTWNNSGIQHVNGATNRVIRSAKFSGGFSGFSYPALSFDENNRSIAIGSKVYPLGDDKYFVISPSPGRRKAGYFVTITNGVARVYHFQTINDFYTTIGLAINSGAKSSFYIDGNKIFAKSTTYVAGSNEEHISQILDINSGLIYVPNFRESREILKDFKAQEVEGIPILEFVKQKVDDYSKSRGTLHGDKK